MMILNHKNCGYEIKQQHTHTHIYTQIDEQDDENLLAIGQYMIFSFDDEKIRKTTKKKTKTEHRSKQLARQSQTEMVFFFLYIIL